jgi:integrase
MARKVTGSVYESRGIWYAAITVAEGTRESFAMPTCKTRDQAEARKDIVNDVVQRLRGAGHEGLVLRFASEAAERPAGKDLDRLLRTVDALCSGKMVPKDLLSEGSTIQEIGEAWTSGKLAQEHRDRVGLRVGADEIDAKLKKHVYPYVGDIPVGLFTEEHGEKVLSKLPESHEQGSRRNVAKLLNRIVNLAVYPLKLIKHNPLPKGWIPKPGPAKARSCIYPREDVRLMGSGDVPLGLRVLWGYLHREGHRKMEAFGLTFSDFDLDLGTVNLDKNKTDNPRFWVLAPGVARLLRAWKAYREEREGPLAGSAYVFFAHGDRPLEGRVFHAARTYRDNLEAAGIKRPQLFERNANRRQVRAHDTRAAFVTVALTNGRNEVWISDRTGHTSMAEMANYRRAARTFAELHLGDWLPLDQLIPELRAYLPAEQPAGVQDAAEQRPAEQKVAEQPTAAPAAEQPAAQAAEQSADRMSAEASAEAVVRDAAATAEPAEEAVVACIVAPAGVPACAANDAPCFDGEGADGAMVGACATWTPGSEDGAPGGREGAGEAIVGAIVGAVPHLGLGGGVVGVAFRLDLPRMRAVQSPPTFGAWSSPSGTAPARGRTRRCGWSRPRGRRRSRTRRPAPRAAASRGRGGRGSTRSPSRRRASAPCRTIP